MNIKESFCSIYNNHIVREGSQALLSWLLESDFSQRLPAPNITVPTRAGLWNTACMSITV